MVKEKKDEYVIFHIEGGHGKVCMATAVIRAIKKKYPNKKLIVTCAWDGPLFNNPNIYRFYNFNEIKYFFGEQISAHRKNIVSQFWFDLFFC